jgi:phosphoglycolate phosphatase
MSVLSNKPDPMTQAMVDGLLPRELFSSVAGERKGVPRKPDPTSALRAAEFMNLHPRECAFVGDLAVDVETAKRAGMVAVAVTWGFASEEALATAEPDHMARTPADILELF